LKCKSSGVYTGLLDEEGTCFTYASILRHFGCPNRHFKSFLASTLGSEVLVGTSWDAKLLYVGAPNDETVEIVIDVFHGLRVQMVSSSRLTPHACSHANATPDERFGNQAVSSTD
jgi:hypothetical protein